MIDFEQKTAPEIAAETAARVKARRKEARLTQKELAAKAGMSYSSYRRFERTGEISFASLAAVGIALRKEDDFDRLFEKRGYSSIEEVIEEGRKARKNGR